MPDDSAAFVARFGEPDAVDAAEPAGPQAPSATRSLVYRRARVRAVFAFGQRVDDVHERSADGLRETGQRIKRRVDRQWFFFAAERADAQEHRGYAESFTHRAVSH